MKTRIVIVVAFLAATLVGIGYDSLLHGRMRKALAQQAALAERAGWVTRALGAFESDAVAMRSRLAVQRERKQGRRATESTPAAAPNSNAARIKTSEIAENPALRAKRVQAFVGERRMIFAGFLHGLGFTPEQLARFDAIQAEYEQGMLDVAGSEAAHRIENSRSLAPLRQQLTDARDAQLETLFGPAYPGWQEANRMLGPRTAVAQLLEQTFQSAGPVDRSHAEQLIATVARHTTSESTAERDWNAIATDAATVLSGAQLEAFQTACAMRQAEARMRVVAAHAH